jgi:hypothetical protein
VIYVKDVDGAGVIADRLADAVLAALSPPLPLERLAEGDTRSALSVLGGRQSCPSPAWA